MYLAFLEPPEDFEQDAFKTDGFERAEQNQINNIVSGKGNGKYYLLLGEKVCVFSNKQTEFINTHAHRVWIDKLVEQGLIFSDRLSVLFAWLKSTYSLGSRQDRHAP